ncbi:MAG: 30S ribosomal protein S6 [Candidatus Paceibacterota bacterium]
MESEENKKYELGYLLSPMVPAEDLEEVLAEEITKPIAKIGGEITANSQPQLRDLAYAISKKIGNSRTTFRHAYFGYIQFIAEPAAVTKLNEVWIKNEKLVRVLLIIAPKLTGKKKVSSRPPVANRPSPNHPPAPVESKLVDEKAIDRQIEGLLTEV